MTQPTALRGGSGSWDAPLWLSLGAPASAIASLTAFVALESGEGVSVTAIISSIMATVLIYGVDRWRDAQKLPDDSTGKHRSSAIPWVLLFGVAALLWCVALLHGWHANHVRLGSTALWVFASGLLLCLGYGASIPWFHRRRIGLKNIPGVKSIFVSCAVSTACVALVFFFPSDASAPATWSKWYGSQFAYLVGVTGMNAQLFDLRDIQRDRASNTPSLAVLWGINRARHFAFLWLIFWLLVSIVLLPEQTPDQIASISGISRGLGIVAALFALQWTSKRRSPCSYFVMLDGSLVIPLCAWMLMVALP